MYLSKKMWTWFFFFPTIIITKISLSLHLITAAFVIMSLARYKVVCSHPVNFLRAPHEGFWKILSEGFWKILSGIWSGLVSSVKWVNVFRKECFRKIKSKIMECRRNLMEYRAEPKTTGKKGPVNKRGV